MGINRRRAPSSYISSLKKRAGHKEEEIFAELIGGEVIKGTQKTDVIDHKGKNYSIKSGKKWQIFLYSYERISKCHYLKILKSCLDAFSSDYELYKKDRIKCIEYKENYIQLHGRDATKDLPNEEIANVLGNNEYIDAKELLSFATEDVCKSLNNKSELRKFLGEAFFNIDEVDFLVVKDTTFENDGLFKVFSRDESLDILTNHLAPSISKAGRVPEDYNVAGQKTILRYQYQNKPKNIIEVEIRNDSSKHYRQVRFNAYSKDTLYLLLTNLSGLKFNDYIFTYGRVTDYFNCTFR